MRDADVEAYVNRIGQKLAANAGGPQFQYRFRVINASDINAFALPGGFVYLNRGIIENARNEGEVAGVLAHEIAHSSLRHGTHQASKAYAAQAGLQILGGLLAADRQQHRADLNTVGGVGLNALPEVQPRAGNAGRRPRSADSRGQRLHAGGHGELLQHAGEGRHFEEDPWLSNHPARRTGSRASRRNVSCFASRPRRRKM